MDFRITCGFQHVKVKYLFEQLFNSVRITGWVKHKHLETKWSEYVVRYVTPTVAKLVKDTLQNLAKGEHATKHFKMLYDQLNTCASRKTLCEVLHAGVDYLVYLGQTTDENTHIVVRSFPQLMEWAAMRGWTPDAELDLSVEQDRHMAEEAAHGWLVDQGMSVEYSPEMKEMHGDRVRQMNTPEG